MVLVVNGTPGLAGNLHKISGVDARVCAGKARSQGNAEGSKSRRHQQVRGVQTQKPHRLLHGLFGGPLRPGNPRVHKMMTQNL